MAHERHQPIQTSAVFLLNQHTSSHPPPPSPPTPCETRAISPLPDDLATISPLEYHDACPKFERRIANAVHVLSTEATALSCLTRLYETDPIARGGFNRAVDGIIECMSHRGKVVVCGVGKSGHIAKKLVATMNSLKISATYLHPTEALHGDLGKVGDFDVILLITFSGKTPELLSLIPHFNPNLPLLVLTSHTNPSSCAIMGVRPDAILLPAPIHESEIRSFGVSAPTTSTTIALALGDALTVTVSNELHPSVSDVFLRNHPGGAIGQTVKKPRSVADLATSLDDIPFADDLDCTNTKAVHIIMTGYRSSSGWVRLQGGLIPPSKIRLLRPEHMEVVATELPGLVVPVQNWVRIPGDLSPQDALSWLQAANAADEEEDVYTEDTVLATMVDGHITGVIEASTISALSS